MSHAFGWYYSKEHLRNNNIDNSYAFGEKHIKAVIAFYH